jgi:activator of HSP90 ATPase
MVKRRVKELLATFSSGDEAELDLSGQDLDAEDAALIANAIRGSRALSKLSITTDSGKSVTLETSMTEANFSGKGLGISGAIITMAFLPKCP